MHSAGVGGGGFMTVYIRSLNKVQIFDHREVAPKLANSTMYINSSLSSRYGKINTFSLLENNRCHV